MSIRVLSKKEIIDRIVVLFTAVFIAIAFIFIYKTDMIVGQKSIKEIIVSNEYGEDIRVDKGNLILCKDEALVYEEDIRLDWNKINFKFAEATSNHKDYMIEIQYVKYGEGVKVITKNVTEESENIVCFSSEINEADSIRIYIIGDSGQKINLESIEFLDYGIKISQYFWLYLVVLATVLYSILFLADKYEKIDFSVKRKGFFYLLITLGIVLFCLQGYRSYGETMLSILHNNKADTYMDFFNSIQYGSTPYEQKVIYPPLVNCIYAFLGHFVPESIFDTEGPFGVRESQYGRVLIGIYITICTLVYGIVIREIKDGSIIEKYYFLFVSIGFVPFLFILERGNIILITMCLTLVFIYGYNSENNLIRHFAMICLAVAVAFKIYPVVFGILLLREKRYKDVFWSIFYGIIIFFGPIVLLGGIKNIKLLIVNIFNTSQLFTTRGYGYNVNLENVLTIQGTLFSNLSLAEKAGSILTIICMFVGSVLVLFGKYKDEWKRVAILSLLMILIPSISYTYALIYMIIPLIMFLDSKGTANKTDYIYIILFVLIFIPVNNTISFYTEDVYPVNTATLIEGIGLLIMLVGIYMEGIYSLCKNR